MYRHLYILTLLPLFLLFSCVDPVAPTFELEAGFLLMEGQIADKAGKSEIRAKRSEILFNSARLRPLGGLQVSSIDEFGNELLWLEVEEEPGTYRPPTDFAASSGVAYHIRLLTAEGRQIESAPERVPTALPVDNARFSFEQEAYFSVNRDRFIPAFRILVDVEDPADERNYFQWKHSTYEFISVCARCRQSVWRNGMCVGGSEYRFVDRYDYSCDAACWAKRLSNDIRILSDEFSQGQRIRNIEAGRLDFDWFGGLLAEVEQFSISKRFYDYNNVIKDLTEGSGGLNASLPAALIGNLRDVADPAAAILGYVAVVAHSDTRIYINRDTVSGTPLPYDATVLLEPLLPSPPTAPCEGNNRTRIRPLGWPE